MKEGFNSILALVDFSSASIHAAEEAAMITAKFNSHLHLLHVTSNASLSYLLFPEVFFFPVEEEDKEASRNNKFRLEKMKIGLEKKYGIHIRSHEAKGSLKEIVSCYAVSQHTDLVVVGAKKKSGFREFFGDSVAEVIINTVDCKVLCIYPESSCSRLKKIVLPVGKFIPKRKIGLAYELARKFAAHVHLISLNKNTDGLSAENTEVLLAAYQYLKDITNIPVECRTVPGNNIAEAAVTYAETIGADMILVNPGAESRLPRTFPYKKGSDIVNHSSIPVLSVHSILEKTN